MASFTVASGCCARLDSTRAVLASHPVKAGSWGRNTGYPLRRSSLLPSLTLGSRGKNHRVSAAAKQYPKGGPQSGKNATPGTGAFIGKLGSDSPATRTAAGASPSSARPRQVLTGNAIFLSLAVAIAVPVLGGALVSSFASPLQDWYRDLDKPSWEPPDWLFGTVWTVLYVLMGVASWLVWADGGWSKQGDTLRLYFLQLLVNLSWPVVFFKLHALRLGLIVLGALAFLVNGTTQSFFAVNKVAGWLMVPYFAWSLFALVLNFSIWRRNSGSSDVGDGGEGLSGATWTSAMRPKKDSDW